MLGGVPLFWRDDQIWAGVALVAGVVVAVWVVFAVALGVVGTTPGKAAVGVRAVHVGTGTPIGFGRALLRGLVLGVATMPTFGIGLATLAWTAVADPTRRRRGWHDHVARSIVVDLRPEPERARGGRQRPAARGEPDGHAAGARRRSRRRRPRRAGRRAPRPSRPAPPAPAAPQPAPVGVPESSAPCAGQPVVTPTGAERRAGCWPSTPASGSPSTAWCWSAGAPSARPGEAVRHLVALPSQDMSLSKTHAQVGVAGDGALVVMDRGSTNGSVLTRQGVSRPLSGGKPTTLLEGDLVRFGDRSMEVSRQG